MASKEHNYLISIYCIIILCFATISGAGTRELNRGLEYILRWKLNHPINKEYLGSAAIFVVVITGMTIVLIMQQWKKESKFLND